MTRILKIEKKDFSDGLPAFFFTADTGLEAETDYIKVLDTAEFDLPFVYADEKYSPEDMIKASQKFHDISDIPKGKNARHDCGEDLCLTGKYIFDCIDNTDSFIIIAIENIFISSSIDRWLVTFWAVHPYHSFNWRF